MKFSELNKYKPSNLVVSPRYEAWMEENANPVYSVEARIFAAHSMVDMGRPRDRRGTVSASSSGSCRRKQQFTFLGLPELPPTAKLAAIFQTGTYMHIRWQMAGLTAGWLVAAEVPVGDNPYRLSGTQDGIADEGTVVEFKSINSNGFSSVKSYGPRESHKFQVATYLLTTGAEQGTIVYENKDTQDYTEVVLPRSSLPIAEVETSVGELWEHNDSNQLYDVLDKCWSQSGFQYKGCPFRNSCMGITSWEEAEVIADNQSA